MVVYDVHEKQIKLEKQVTAWVEMELKIILIIRPGGAVEVRLWCLSHAHSLQDLLRP